MIKSLYYFFINILFTFFDMCRSSLIAHRLSLIAYRLLLIAYLSSPIAYRSLLIPSLCRMRAVLRQYKGSS